MDALMNACPFLRNLAAAHGPDFAKSVAISPTTPASQPRSLGLVEESYNFGKTFQAFHGPGGVVPLARTDAAGAAKLHPFLRSALTEPVGCPAAQAALAGQPLAACPVSSAPLATISLGAFGGMPDFGAFMRSLQLKSSQHSFQQPKPRPPQPPSASASSSISSRSAPSTASGKGFSRAPPPPPSKPPALSSGAASPSLPSSHLALQRALGPFAGAVLNKAGHITCPEVIVRARAALASTQPIRELRPQAVAIKLAAVGAMSATVNLPLGAWREHFTKFSPGWVIAVHASIPFIAMLRKAVILPKYAILFTIATAVAGQAIGARIERRRLALIAKKSSSNARLVVAAGKSADLGDTSGLESTAALPPQQMVASASGSITLQTVQPTRSKISAGKTPLPVLQKSGRGTVAGVPMLLATGRQFDGTLRPPLMMSRDALLLAA